MLKMSWLPSWLDTKASRLPSGDQTGLMPAVSEIGPVPSGSDRIWMNFSPSAAPAW
jgi:hypothetical protein